MIRDKDAELYFDFARRAAEQSSAKRLQVGAVLVSPDHVMAMGYNGTPSGESNVCENVQPDGSLVTKPDVIHAELNALFKFQRKGVSTKGTVMFLTHAPCLECAKAIYLAEVSEVRYLNTYRSIDGIEFLFRRGIRVEQAGVPHA